MTFFREIDIFFIPPTANSPPMTPGLLVYSAALQNILVTVSFSQKNLSFPVRETCEKLEETNREGYSPFRERGFCERPFRPICSQLTTGPLQQRCDIAKTFSVIINEQ